ncbi:MAG: hypothetical protein KDB22_12415 [Planctomycetales bacterium]|nr:hypothetical protein [Planctomycetales bacterium]
MISIFVLLSFRAATGQAVSSNPVAEESIAKPSFETPPAPALRPEKELDTIKLVDGFRLELVATDPLIQDPIALTFDPDGRLWVCEMRGFMPDIDGTGEDAPVGVISVLKDTNQDGLMDQSTVFLDGLVLPRGLCWTIDGMLVCENGTIWLCTDSDGDDRCDQKQAVCSYNVGNLEHSLNGLMPALDNWVYNAKEGIRLKRVDGRWIHSTTAARGQWGITQDNVGYLYYNVNASLLRGDLVPCYSPIAESNNSLVDIQFYSDQEMFPIRPTPGINRGYIPGFLRPDGTLIEANSNCGPVVYRGDCLPSELLGNVFIPDPAGNLIRRQVVQRQDWDVMSFNAYSRQEFLASTDERFRPVNMFNAPDGTLYVVDMYRGVIQHGAFITPYLREQILSRELDKEIHLGRIWRVVHQDSPRRPNVRLSQLSDMQLVNYLSHANGWHRDMAQQLLVQRGSDRCVPQLEELVLHGDNELGRLHALWTLEGLNCLDPQMMYAALADQDVNVRMSAITLYQNLLAIDSYVPTVIEDLSEIADDRSTQIQTELVQSLGLIDSLQAEQVIEPILKSAAQGDPRHLDGLLNGFTGRECEFLAARLNRSSWKTREAWRETVLDKLAAILWRQRNPVTVLRFCHLLDSIPSDRQWQQVTLLEGVRDPAPKRRFRRFPPAPGTAPAPATAPSTLTNNEGRQPLLVLATPPVGLERLQHSSDPRLSQAADALAARLAWPGKDGQPLPEKPRLSDEQQRLVEIGRLQYATLCAGCHHSAGYGLAAKGPELLGSNWLEDSQRLMRVALHGLEGPISINGGLYNEENRMSMPGLAQSLDDEHIAGVLSYVRREFIDGCPPIDVAEVTALREQTKNRTTPWTQAELYELSGQN